MIQTSIAIDKDARNDVFTTCVQFYANWKNIGLTLEISASSLDDIAERNMESESGCMRDMLDLWLSCSNEGEEQLRPMHLQRSMSCYC